VLFIISAGIISWHGDDGQLSINAVEDVVQQVVILEAAILLGKIDGLEVEVAANKQRIAAFVNRMEQGYYHCKRSENA